MTNQTTTKDLLAFLKKLDDSDVNVNDWEAKFIESNLNAESFSLRQRQAIQEMMEKYGKRIGWY